jgi:hypothetical protein
MALLVDIRPAAAAPLAIHIHSDRAMFQVLISPGTVGTDRFVLQLMSGDGNLLRVKDATAPAHRISRCRRTRALRNQFKVF